MNRVTREQAQQLSSNFYGHRLKDCQADIMALVLDMSLPRVAILGATQIEKSRAAARAIGILAASVGIGVTIVGPKAEQAITPLRYFISMIDTVPYFQAKMLLGGERKVERLKASEAKDYLAFKKGELGEGFIRSVTLNERDSDDKKKTNLGQGSQVVLFEEASLSSNETEAMVLRMVAGWGYKGRIIKLGNAITREADHDHFYRAINGEDGYVSLTVDYHRALAEGIYTPEFIEEAKKRPFFDSLYGCQFPDPSGLVKGGYTRLLKLEQILAARGDETEQTGQPIIGIDVGQGKPDRTSIVVKWPNFAKRVYTSDSEDVMAQIGEYEPILRQLNPSIIYVDAVGLGAGVASRLRELGFTVVEVIAGATAPEEGYANAKAFGYMKIKDAIENLGLKLGVGDWNQLGEVAYKIRSDKSVIIESKDELKARGVPSYNDAEALMLCFADTRGVLGEDSFIF